MDAVFGALGSGERLQLLNEVATGRADQPSVLAARLAWTRSRVAKHLRVLDDAQLIRRDRVRGGTRITAAGGGYETARAWFEQLPPPARASRSLTLDRAPLYAALRHPARRHIVLVVMEAGRYALFEQLEESTGLPQPVVSRHVSTLAQAGLIDPLRGRRRTFLQAQTSCIPHLLAPLDRVIASAAQQDG